MRFKAHLSTQNLDHGDAEETYISAHKAIEKLNKGFADMELFLSSPPKQVRPEQVLEGILPLLQNQILRSHSAFSQLRIKWTSLFVYVSLAPVPI